MLRHFFPSRWLHPLAPLKRLSPVNLLAANGFNKPFAASKFKLCVENNPPYDCNHAEDSLFYEHRSIAVGFLILKLLCAVLAVMQLFAEQLGIVRDTVAVIVILDCRSDCLLGEDGAVYLVRGQTVESLNNSLV